MSGIGARHPSPFQYLQHKERSDPRIGIIWTVFTGAASQKYIDYLCTAPLPSLCNPSLSFLYLNHVLNGMKQFRCGAAIYVEMWLGNNCIRGR